MKILSIDPSIKDVGFAVVKNLERNADGVWDNSKADWHWGHWQIDGLSLTYRLREIVEWIILEDLALNPEEDWLVMEWPAYFGSEKGQVAAQMGYTLGLAAVCAYIAAFFRMPPDNTHLITANQWKGNVNKNITRMRFFKALGQPLIYKVNHNAVDAVMLLHEFCKRKKIVWNITSTTVELEQK